jgi:hypothetical protein
METKTGTIKSVSQKQGNGARGAYTQWVFDMEDGKKYSTFDEAIGNAFKAGDAVEFDGEQNGKYWNMTAMRKSSGSLNKVPVSPANAFKEAPGDREKSIIAQCLTKCFSEIAAKNPSLPTETIRVNVLTAYNFFLKSQ